MSYLIKTPMLARSADIAERAAEAVVAGEMSSKEAAAAIYGARTMQGAIKTEVEARLTTLRVAAAIRAAMWRGGLRGRLKSKKAEESVERDDGDVTIEAADRGNCGALENRLNPPAESAAHDAAAATPGSPG